MPNGTGVSKAAKIALSSANTLFMRGDLDLHVQTLNKIDLDWCIALQRFQPDDRRLPWDQCGRTLYDPCVFAFSFKTTEHSRLPAAACICQFCEPTEAVPALLNLEMLQNFRLQDSILDGNTFRFTLYVVAIFMAITECRGLRLIAPVNNRVATYYMRQYGFIDLTEGAREILYHDAAGLYSVLSGTSTRIEDDY
ncbi:hypothetical protein EDF81_0316 [Enterobacter sp. BIGb0383]|nr:hypothetical protein EDF81_0316 [Enterobacter sp. BIGb0383]ROS12003.1 hypothetical protein EC848_0316 [Enterobacter sp. BIGb0359]